jgi:hypothetical protein
MCSKENKNCQLNSTDMCPIIQTYQKLINEIPPELLNLSYAIYPTDQSYNDKRFIYNKLFNYFPHAIFYPQNEDQVSYLITNLVKYNLEFAIRCGGHSYEPASLSEGYVISMDNFSYINIDQQSMTVKAGSGVRLGNLIDVLAEQNFITPTGTSNCVGISGLSLSGGKGLLTRLYGMTCDNIVSVRMVDAIGRIILVNENSFPDLFWAIKGSGVCNYGLITEIELKIYPDIYCQIATLKWNWNKYEIKDILSIYQIWSQITPKNITTDINMNWNYTLATFSIKFFKFTTEPSSSFEELSQFINLFKPTVTICSGYYSKITNCWVDFQEGQYPCFSKMKSTMVFEPICSLGIDVLVSAIDDLTFIKPAQYLQINLSQLGGQVLNGNSSYFPKNAIYVITILNQWNSQNISIEAIKYTNKVYKNLIPFTSKNSFPNMIDYDIKKYMFAYYGTNSSILIDIKTKYDPNNVFKWKQSIPIRIL